MTNNDRSLEFGVEILPERIYSLPDIRIALGCDQSALAEEVKSGRLKTIIRAGAVIVRGGDVLAWLTGE